MEHSPSNVQEPTSFCNQRCSSCGFGNTIFSSREFGPGGHDTRALEEGKRHGPWTLAGARMAGGVVIESSLCDAALGSSYAWPVRLATAARVRFARTFFCFLFMSVTVWHLEARTGGAVGAGSRRGSFGDITWRVIGMGCVCGDRRREALSDSVVPTGLGRLGRSHAHGSRRGLRI